MAKPGQTNNTFETVHRLADIPDLQTGAEEHAFWSTHELGEELLNAAQPLAREVLPPPRKRTTNLAVRFDATTIRVGSFQPRKQRLRLPHRSPPHRLSPIQPFQPTIGKTRPKLARHPFRRVR